MQLALPLRRTAQLQAVQGLANTLRRTHPRSKSPTWWWQRYSRLRRGLWWSTLQLQKWPCRYAATRKDCPNSAPRGCLGAAADEAFCCLLLGDMGIHAQAWHNTEAGPAASWVCSLQIWAHLVVCRRGPAMASSQSRPAASLHLVVLGRRGMGPMLRAMPGVQTR